jgi:hypothetical protein
MDIDRKLTIRTLEELLSNSYTGCKYDDTYDSIEVFGDVEKPSLEVFRAKYIELRDHVIPMEEFRRERDKRLKESDWVTLKAYSTQKVVPKAWCDYMQALRDLPSVTEDPVNPVWPTPPE